MDDERPTPSVLAALWRYRWSSLTIVVVVLAVSAGYGFLTRAETQATAKMILATPSGDDVVGVSAPTEPTFVRYVQQRALFVTSQQVLQAASDDLGNLSVQHLRERVTSTADSDGRSINVTASGPTPARAAAVSNAVVAAYRDQSKAQMLDAANAALDAINRSETKIVSKVGQEAAARNSTYQDLNDQESTIAIATAKFGSGVTFVDPATAASAQKPPLPLLDVGIGLALGLLIAGTVAWLRADRLLSAAAATGSEAASNAAGVPLGTERVATEPAASESGTKSGTETDETAPPSAAADTSAAETSEPETIEPTETETDPEPDPETGQAVRSGQVEFEADRSNDHDDAVEDAAEPVAAQRKGTEVDGSGDVVTVPVKAPRTASPERTDRNGRPAMQSVRQRNRRRR